MNSLEDQARWNPHGISAFSSIFQRNRAYFSGQNHTSLDFQ
jgi:hypothetical protein